MTTWRCYLEGGEHPVTIVTDHQPVTYLPTKTNLSRRQARWAEYMSRFNIVWVYKPGRVNVADPLSRQPSLLMALTTRHRARKRARNISGAAKGLADSSEFVASVRKAYQSDAWLQSAEGRSELSQSNRLWWHGAGDQKCLYVPDSGDLRKQCLRLVHDHPFSGHLGVAKTHEQFQRLYWWPSWRAEVETYVGQCNSCQRNKGAHQKPAGKLQPLPIPGKLWESISMDFITHLPETTRGHTSIFVVVDRLSKMTHFIPMKDTSTAEDIAQLCIDQVVRYHGCPRDIVSDRDARFTGRFWTYFCQRLAIDSKKSTAFHPQSDGQSERVNRVLQDVLRHYVSPLQDDWDQHLTAAEFAVNNAYHESIKTTPFYLNYGQNPLTPANLQIPKVDNPRAMELTSTLQGRLKLAKACMHAAQQRQKAYADQKRRDVEFSVGQQVLLSSKNIRVKGPITPKLMPKWIGPFSIAKRIGKLAYKLDLPSNMRIHNVFHVSLLKEYRSDGTVQPPPVELLENNDVEFEVDMILGHRDHIIRKTRSKSSSKTKTTSVRQYLVQWTGYGPEHSTWEPETELMRKCSILIDAYWSLLKGQTHM